MDVKKKTPISSESPAEIKRKCCTNVLSSAEPQAISNRPQLFNFYIRSFNACLGSIYTLTLIEGRK